MDFGKALEHLKAGQPVRRAQWPEDVSLRLANAVTADPQAKPVLVRGRAWTFEGADLLAEDWTLAKDD
jgi:hypothetical protein